jgi:hypothetical protein
MREPRASAEPPCALCKRIVALRTSHILPAFVFRWLKETSATGYVRISDMPDKRAQDGPKTPWLCADCEQLLNSFETPFATKIFHPWNANNTRRLPYSEWMLKFCVSVSWRTWKFFELRDGNQDLSPTERLWGAEACERWEEFLRGERPHPGQFEQHLLPLSPIEGPISPDVPSNANRYLLRALHMDVGVSRRAGFTYTKFGRFALFGFIRKPPELWEGTKIHVRDGWVGPRRIVLPEYIRTYLFDKMRQYAGITGSMSEKQHGKVESAVLRNMDRFIESDTFRAMQHDEMLFGAEALIRKPKTTE